MSRWHWAGPVNHTPGRRSAMRWEGKTKTRRVERSSYFIFSLKDTQNKSIGLWDCFSRPVVQQCTCSARTTTLGLVDVQSQVGVQQMSRLCSRSRRTTAVQLMEARCWQVTELAGNRPSGPKMFSKRQDEEEWKGTEVANKRVNSV